MDTCSGDDEERIWEPIGDDERILAPALAVMTSDMDACSGDDDERAWVTALAEMTSGYWRPLWLWTSGYGCSLWRRWRADMGARLG